MKKHCNFCILVLFFVIALSFAFMYYNKKSAENFQDISMLEPPISNGYYLQGSEPYVGDSGLISRMGNALDRIFNPLRYPYKYPTFYNEMWWPTQTLPPFGRPTNYQLTPPQIVGCGGRRGPCLGGTQTTIMSPLPSIDITEDNIAPINIRTRGPQEESQQVGVIYKNFGNENQVYPLYGRRTFRGSNNWEYYTQMGPMNVKIPIRTHYRSNNELGNGDEVHVQNNKFLVTIYENDSPMYVPYF